MFPVKNAGSHFIVQTLSRLPWWGYVLWFLVALGLYLLQGKGTK
jgi:preprotein translocase subunit SecG